MSVKRYQPAPFTERVLHASDDGEYVKYDDYSALEARCAALAAENANCRNAVQVFCDVVDANTDAICEEVGQDGVKAILAAMSATGNMPATEAFLAEVRASAVDEVCLKISNAIINCYQDEQIGLDAAATICGDFAAQLRKGVPS